MSGLLKIAVLLLALLAFSCATPEKNKKDAKLLAKHAKENDNDDATVEVLEENKAGKAKHHKKHQDEDDEHEDDEDEDDDDEGDQDDEEEEEEDPNAQISTEELYTPKNCANKTRAGNLVVLHYTGWLDDAHNDVFDTTIDPAKGYVPFEFVLGTGTVIKGFERGVAGMCKGQKRRLTIPPALAYGRKGTHDVPGEYCFHSRLGYQK